MASLLAEFPSPRVPFVHWVPAAPGAWQLSSQAGPLHLLLSLLRRFFPYIFARLSLYAYRALWTCHLLRDAFLHHLIQNSNFVITYGLSLLHFPSKHLSPSDIVQLVVYVSVIIYVPTHHLAPCQAYSTWNSTGHPKFSVSSVLVELMKFWNYLCFPRLSPSE